MFYCKFNEAGLGFITPELGWGEVAFLPEKYDELLTMCIAKDIHIVKNIIMIA